MKAIKSVFLICSLLLAGTVAGAHGPDRDRGSRHAGPRGPEAMEMIGHLHHALRRLDLSDEQRAIIKADFRAMKDEIGPLLEELREGRAAMHELLLAEDFDAAAVAAIAEQQGSTNAEIIQIVAGSVHSALSELTPEQRAELEAMQKEHHERMTRHHDRLQERLHAAPPVDG